MKTYLAKSLHTVTALANVAQHLISVGAARNPSLAVLTAAQILGIADLPDTYGLRERAADKIRENIAD